MFIKCGKSRPTQPPSLSQNSILVRDGDGQSTGTGSVMWRTGTPGVNNYLYHPYGRVASQQPTHPSHINHLLEEKRDLLKSIQ